MRFVFTLNLPSFKNNLVQEVVGEYPAKNLQDLYMHFSKGQRWLLVEQYYQTGREWAPRHHILINSDMVGKIREFVENPDDV